MCNEKPSFHSSWARLCHLPAPGPIIVDEKMKHTWIDNQDYSLDVTMYTESFKKGKREVCFLGNLMISTILSLNIWNIL